MTYQMDLTSNIIAEIDKSSHRNIVTDIATFLFPLAVLLTSIPVYSIVVRYNLERSGLCERRMATLLSTFLPWIIVLLFQSGVWLNIFTNWTSLLFTSTIFDDDDKGWFDDKHFTAFPANKKCRMFVAMIASGIAVILVEGIIIYDFVKLAPDT
ncbi:hypothetical protein C1645_738582 [Glomus cerebriforme]|uniref:Uncharacterized protein n=1 Tax=Glomus cerebriforme TaxID=658196 RepID=A0A397SWX9_9GLOM|nr:hypothetical protein C1645_738582 [Glomus cerebriforme]